MAYIKDYWINKEKRAEKAEKHTKIMKELYASDIDLAIKKTRIYSTDFKCNKETKDIIAEIIVEDLDTVGAGSKYADGTSMALLNFASFKNPGGMFIKGSKAQEECLCHSSFLYNVLQTFTDSFYAWNNKHLNRSLYWNRGLFTPNVKFRDHEDEYWAHVITCAAPNKSSAQKYCNISDTVNSQSLKDRIRFVLDIAKENNVEILILGAYGCGVFGQDPTEVANIFKEFLTTTHRCFKKVVFAIPSGKTGNLEAFEKVFIGD